MKWRDPKTWLAAASLSFVVTLAVIDLDRATPGPLHPAHERDERLLGNDGCEQCHGAKGDGMADACNACHEPIAAQLASGTGLHGTLETADPTKCAQCHVEHHGQEVALVDDRSFALAGVPDRLAFDHRRLGSPLTGVHDQLECTKCHEHAEDALLPLETTRYTGLSVECASCHEDPHDGRMAQGCAACHGQEGPFEELRNFVHTEAFPLLGAHAGHDCKRCHEPATTFELEAVASTSPPPARGCADCHEARHRPSFLAAAAASLGGDADRACAACHSPEHGAALEAGFRQTTFEIADHALTGFPLDAPHADVECAACHAGGATAELERAPRRTDDCAACHADPHAGQFAARGCVECHAPDHFQPHEFDAVDHAVTAFPLEGAHARAACVGCHVDPPQGESRQFLGVAQECAVCHENPHGDTFVDPLTALAPSCAECHGTETFQDAHETESFDHAATGFALTGAHARAECATCHPATTPDPVTGRDFARAAVAFGQPIDGCASCHADPHEGTFGRPFASGDCARCHATESFEVTASAFDHEATGFGLRGAHRQTACAVCHPDVPADDFGRTFARATQRFGGPIDGCASCHGDAHLGAFDQPGLPAAVDGREGCARCHEETSFRAIGDDFDHGLWTGYPLDAAHARASCFQCHAPRPSPDAQGRTYERAKGTRCSDCHADPHVGQFRGTDRTTDCARCHAVADAFHADAFDHDTQSRFQLDGDHRGLSCSSCHKPWPLPDGREVVRYRPLGTRCGDCHGFDKEDR